MWLRTLFTVAIGLTLLGSASAQNTGQRLIDGTATFDYTSVGIGSLPSGPPVGSGNVSMNFQLDGASGDPTERQILKGNWFYRVAGDTRERYLGDASAKTTLGNDYVKWDFPDVYGAGATKIPNLSAEMDFRLTSHNPDSATLTTGLCFRNTGSTAIQVESFFVIDFQLDATSSGDVFAQLDTTSGRLIQADDGLTTGVMFANSTSGSSMDNDGSLFGLLNNGSPDTFPDVNSSGGNFGDGAALLQFDHIIPPSAGICIPTTVTISIARNGETPVVPEPTGLSLVLGMLVVVGTRRLVALRSRA